MNFIHSLHEQQITRTQHRTKIKAFFTAWIAMSVIMGTLGYLIITAVQISRGDLNHDGVIDAKDSAIVAARGSLSTGDLNGDGKVDAQDAAILSSNRTDKTVLQRESIQAQTSSPVKIVSKPVFYLQ